MTHLWVRAEQRPNEDRVGLTPEGAKALLSGGIKVTVEESAVRAIPLQGYIDVGCDIAAENSWPTAPLDAIIFGLKELPEDGTPLRIATSCLAMPLRASIPAKPCCSGFRPGVAPYMIWSIWWMKRADALPPLAIGLAMPGLP